MPLGIASELRASSLPCFGGKTGAVVTSSFSNTHVHALCVRLRGVHPCAIVLLESLRPLRLGSLISVMPTNSSFVKVLNLSAFSPGLGAQDLVASTGSALSLPPKPQTPTPPGKRKPILRPHHLDGG